ncbi:hypothetical protein [Pseudomonas sp. TE3610]
MFNIDLQNLSDAERARRFHAMRLPAYKHAAPGFSTRTLPDDDDADFKPAEGEEHGVVLGDSVVTLEPKMSNLALEAVQYSTFYAQIWANGEYPNKEKDLKEWYTAYTEAMTFMGWNMTSFQFKEQQTNNTSVDVDQIALKMLAAAAGPGAAGAVLMASIKAGLEGLKESKKAIGLFHKESAKENNGSFQLIPGGELSNGSPMILLNSVYCSTKKNMGKILFVSWNNSDVRVWGNAQKLGMILDIYKRNENKIKDELDDYLVSGFHEKFKLKRKPK